MKAVRNDMRKVLFYIENGGTMYWENQPTWTTHYRSLSIAEN